MVAVSVESVSRSAMLIVVVAPASSTYTIAPVVEASVVNTSVTLVSIVVVLPSSSTNEKVPSLLSVIVVTVSRLSIVVAKSSVVVAPVSSMNEKIPVVVLSSTDVIDSKILNTPPSSSSMVAIWFPVAKRLVTPIVVSRSAMAMVVVAPVSST